MTIKLKPQTETQIEQHKRMYGSNWQYHYRQWELFNTPQGSKQITKYVKSLETK